MIGGFRSVLCVSVFQGSLIVIVIMIDGSEKRNCEGGLELQSSHVCEKRSKNTSKYSLISSSFYYCPHCGLEMTIQGVIKLLVRFSTYFYVRDEFL